MSRQASVSFRESSFFSLNSEGFHRVVYSDWGDPDAEKVLICVHGLTGNGHDFDVLAPVFANDCWRVVAVDLPGRGRSDFLPDPQDYSYRQYWSDLTALLADLNVKDGQKVDWLGVSLGGLLGIYLAALPNTPIRRLILNDVGPEVPQEALQFIAEVISMEYRFDTLDQFEQRLRETRGLSWGPMTDDHWRHMAEHNARALDDGSLTYAYDPQISDVFKIEPIGPVDLWPYWHQIHCPLMVLWGTQSGVLTQDIVAMMKSSKPDLTVAEFPDCGHVPSLMDEGQIAKIQDFFNINFA